MGFGETVAVEGPGSDALKERLRNVKTACSRTIQNAGADRLCAVASPLMRERRINATYDALFWAKVASKADG
jgi:hypothetical protein